MDNESAFSASYHWRSANSVRRQSRAPYVIDRHVSTNCLASSFSSNNCFIPTFSLAYMETLLSWNEFNVNSNGDASIPSRLSSSMLIPRVIFQNL